MGLYYLSVYGSENLVMLYFSLVRDSAAGGCG